MIESAYNCQNQAIVSVNFRFEAPQTTLRPVKLLKMFIADSVLYHIQKELDYTQVKDLKTTIYLLTPTSPQLDVKKPQDIVRPESLSLLAEGYDRCVQVCSEYAKTFYLGWDLLLLSLLSFMSTTYMSTFYISIFSLSTNN
ncbi:hypothetical protein IGI04_033088 [Brassica rapa subsp. trilocularis]|uniref:Uncharacterized protein n=1 Tax=Brassica rapa subsp. trilocularis TaxID=1813537 RepID=A0ABQ7L4Z9_BRACM|nr:hypothetical protein IGI04_033088 [Brassica rapa subsp. trilocularis]